MLSEIAASTGAIAEATRILRTASASSVKSTDTCVDAEAYLSRKDEFLAVMDKLRRNAEKYPVEKAKGNAAKYDQF